MKTKGVSKQFLMGFVSNGATVTTSAMKELNKLTDECLDDIHSHYYFNELSIM